MTTHEWRERDEEGTLVYYRAKHHAGRWSFQSRPKNAETWEAHEPVPREILESFRAILWNKIQRRRAPEKHIDAIDAMIDAHRKIADAESISPDQREPDEEGGES